MIKKMETSVIYLPPAQGGRDGGEENRRSELADVFQKNENKNETLRLCTGWGTLEIDWAIKESGGQTTQRISRSLPLSRYPSATWN